MIKHVGKVEVKDDEVEKLLRKLPSGVLEIYKAIEGKFYVVYGDITKHKELIK
ncbi:TPA: hypothetical protein QCP64_005700 [Bacillus cereus]|nr:hypothetical protein [Bacillus cereus]